MFVDSDTISTTMIGGDTILPHLAKKANCETTNLVSDIISNNSTHRKKRKLSKNSQKSEKQECYKKRSWTRSEDCA